MSDPAKEPSLNYKGRVTAADRAAAFARNTPSPMRMVPRMPDFPVFASYPARLLNLAPRGTVFVLLSALGKNKIDLDEFLEVLDELIKQGFRLKEEVYIEAIKEARRIALKG